MKRLYFLLTGFVLTISSAAQEIDRHVADSLLQVLTKNKSPDQRIEALIKLAEFHVFKPGENKTDFDSADACLQEAQRLNNSVYVRGVAGRILLMQAFMLREKGDETNGRKAVEQSIPLLKKSAYPYYLGRAYFELSGYYEWLDSAQRRQRTALTHKAVHAFQEAGEMEQKGHALRMLGDLYAANREHKTALVYLTQAVAVYDSIHHERLQGVYELMSRSYLRTGDFKHAIQYGLLALKTAKAVGDSSMQLATINNSLGSLYRQAGHKALAIEYYKNALAVALRLDETSHVLSIAYNASICYLDLNQPREAINFLHSLPAHHTSTTHPIGRTWINSVFMRAYELEGNYEASLTHCRALEKLIHDPAQPKESNEIVYILLGRYYLRAGDKQKARMYVDKSFTVPTPAISQMAADRFFLAYKLDSAEGNYKSSLSHLANYKSVSDSMFNEVKFRQFQELEVEFETTKKADSILLLTQKTELQTANLRRSDLVKKYTIGGILLALLVIVLLYRQYQLKQRNNKAMAEKNERLQRLVTEKEWLLKEVHHRVKNNLQTIMSLLELQADTANKDARFAIQTSQNRIYTTSLLHQKLYRSDNMSSVNMQVYLTELIQHLRDAYVVNNNIFFRTNIAPIELDITQGVPIGLIVNEVVTNSLKYAFNGQIAQPEITVSLTRSGDMIDLLIADNGVGFSPADNNSIGLGLKLVNGLAEDIEGRIVIAAENGTSILIRFNPSLSLVTSVNPS